MNNVPNVAPGEVLLEEFLIPMDISRRALAHAAGVPPRRIDEIVLGKRGISADSAMRLQGTATSRVARKSPPI
jgi:addiction module HigA family antidote